MVNSETKEFTTEFLALVLIKCLYANGDINEATYQNIKKKYMKGDTQCQHLCQDKN